MENKYRHTNTTVSSINYHFVFCPRYRRKILLIPNVEERFKELVKMKCKELEIEIIAMESDKDHSHMFLNCLPILSPSDLMQQIKGYNYQKCLAYGQEVILFQPQEIFNFFVFGTFLPWWKSKKGI